MCIRDSLRALSHAAHHQRHHSARAAAGEGAGSQGNPHRVSRGQLHPGSSPAADGGTASEREGRKALRAGEPAQIFSQRHAAQFRFVPDARHRSELWGLYLGGNRRTGPLPDAHAPQPQIHCRPDLHQRLRRAQSLYPHGAPAFQRLGHVHGLSLIHI